MQTRIKIDVDRINQRIDELTELLDGGPDKAGECDRCHKDAGVWLDESDGCGDWEFCRRCLHKELVRLRALRRMGIRTGGVR